MRTASERSGGLSKGSSYLPSDRFYPIRRSPRDLCYRWTQWRWQIHILFFALEEYRTPFRERRFARRDLDLDAYSAAEVAAAIRKQLIQKRESFVFETVFSDPAGEKVLQRKTAQELGYLVVLCFIGIPAAETSEERVAMRVSQGGHDVPNEKLIARFPRVLDNLKRAIHDLAHVLVFDNSDLSHPYRLIAAYREGALIQAAHPMPDWFALVSPT